MKDAVMFTVAAGCIAMCERTGGNNMKDETISKTEDGKNVHLKILISSFRRHDVALSWMMKLAMLSWFTFRSAGIYSGYLVNHLQAFKKGGYPCLPLMGSHFSPGSARGAAFTPLVRSSWPAHAALTFCLTAHLANLRCHKPQVYECACVRVWEGWGRLLKKYLATYLQMKSTDGEKVRLSSSVAFVKFA